MLNVLKDTNFIAVKKTTQNYMGLFQFPLQFIYAECDNISNYNLIHMGRGQLAHQVYANSQENSIQSYLPTLFSCKPFSLSNQSISTTFPATHLTRSSLQ